MLSKKELLILSELRNNARTTLTNISKKTNIPISTIFDKLKVFEEGIIKQHTTLINFSQLGFNARANVMIKVNSNSRESVKEYLSKHHNVNSVFKINNGFDYMFEAVFVNIKDMEDFLEYLDQKFKIENKEIYYIVEDVKKEKFLANPEYIGIVMQNAI